MAPDMKLETLLTSTPVDQWATRQAVIFDWYDGPREGVCALAQPGGEFYFELLDERFNPDDLDDRLFRLSEIPSGSLDKTLGVLSALGNPAGPIWTPVWRFPSEVAREKADQQIARLRADARPTSVVIATRDMLHFLGCWKTDSAPNGITDWFSALGIPQQ